MQLLGDGFFKNTGEPLIAMGTRSKWFPPGILILILLWPRSNRGETVNVFHLQPDIWKAPRDDVFVRFNMTNQGVATSVTEFTVCSRSYHTSITSLQVLLSYASADIYDNAIMMYVRDGLHVFRYNNKPQTSIEKITVPTLLRLWRHYCHVISKDTYTVYVDGVAMANNTIKMDDRVLPLNGTFIVGQEQDGLSRAFSNIQVLKGYASQINFWSYPLDSKTIEDLALCKTNLLGNVFSSDREDMELIGAEKSVAPLRDLCSKDESFILFPESLIFTDSRILCHLIGSELYAPSTPEGNERLLNHTLKYKVCRQQVSMWIGGTDEKEEGVFRRLSDDKILTNIKFKQGQPDNVRTENCLNMESEIGAWSDFPCYDATISCTPCEERLYVTLFLRGLCMNIKTETFFETIGYSNQAKPYFHGYHGLMIFRTTNDQWSLLNTVTNKTQAYLNMSSSTSYPVGRQKWMLTSDVCAKSSGTEIELSLSACIDGQYMCDNGECIDLNTRCDSKDDCSDESDEDNCSTLQLPEDYRSFKPPKNIMNASLPLQLHLKVEFLRFLSIEDVEERIQLEFMIQLSWTDSRIKYRNLREDTLDNALAESEVAKLWRPEINFPNIKDGALKLLGENVYVLKLKKALPADFNDVKMDAMYGGDAAMIVQQQHYSGSFVCVFGVFDYPFDTQRCYILVQISSISKELVAFTANTSQAVYLLSPELPTYIVGDFSASLPINQTRLSIIEVGFTLARRYTLIVLNVFLPTLMLMAIGYATLYVKVQMLEVRSGVALTTLLVLYTFFNQTSASLPQTAYVKLIDVWFFFCTSFLFVIILIHVFVERLDDHVVTPFFARGKEEPERFSVIKEWFSSADKCLIMIRNVIGPIILSVFFIVYFTIMMV